MIVGVDAWGRVVAVPEDVRAERAQLWNGLRTAKTFGELRAAVNREDYETIVSLTEHYSEEEDEGAPSRKWPPNLTREFHPEMIDSYQEQDWPTSISSLMDAWLRDIDLTGIAAHQSNMVSTDWIHIDPRDQDEFVRRLEASGWKVKVSDQLVAEADWR